MNNERRRAPYAIRRRPIDDWQRHQLREGAILMMVIGAGFVLILSAAMWVAKVIGL